MTVQSLAGNGLIALGTFLILSAALGMIRLRDAFSRTNAVAKAGALGVSLILSGVLVLIPSVGVAVMVVLAVAAQLFTAPIAGYTVGRAAYRSGAPLAPSTHRDDLAARKRR
jgi:multicomponent Na+:H+ antiporter subunit G